MESIFSGTLIQKMTKFPHGDNFYGDPDITSFQVYVLLFMIKNPCCQGRCLCSAKYLSSINTGSFVFNNFAFDHYYYELL